MDLVKIPIPVPSVVLSLAVVEFWEILQQTPRAVTNAPPSEITSPPHDAVVAVILVTNATEVVGTTFITSFLQLIRRDEKSIKNRQNEELIFMDLVDS